MDFRTIRFKIKQILRKSDTEKRHIHYGKQFETYSIKNNKCRDERQYEAVITRWYHTIEKGLAYVNFRAGFGQRNINFLLESMENYLDDGYSEETLFYKTALDVLEEYMKKNREHGYEDKELENRIHSLKGIPNESGGYITFTPKTSEELKELNYEELIRDRHSMRHFSDVPVDEESLKRAIRLAQFTPSACNRQGWRTIVIKNRDLLEKVRMNQNGNEGFGQEFDKLLLVTADIRCFNYSRELYQAFIDGGMYAQGLLNALHYEHIASVPLSASLTEEQEANIRKILNLNPSEVLILFIGVGSYPDICQTTKSERRPAEIEII